MEIHGGYTGSAQVPSRWLRVEIGIGNLRRRHRGAVSGTVIGTYPHGPVLARNPALADHVLELGLGRSLPPLVRPEVAELRRQRLAAVRKLSR